MYTLKIIKEGDIFCAQWYKNDKFVTGGTMNASEESFIDFCARMEQKTREMEIEDSLKLIREKHMSLKLKKGDLVCVRSWDEMAEIWGVEDMAVGKVIQIPGCFSPAMREFCGKVFSVSRVIGERVILNGDMPKWGFSPAMLVKLDHNLKEVE